MKQSPAAKPCSTCPYRRDVPSGLWAAEEYQKLPLYDGSVAEQAMAGALGLFACHTQPQKLCAGWVGCHDMVNNLAVRMNLRNVDESVFGYESPVPLFSSGTEACAHGMRDIEDPSPEACRKAGHLERVIRRRKL